MTLKEFFESKEELAINLKTEEQEKIFCNQAYKLGYKWCSGRSYLASDYWDIYKEETCYTNRGFCESIGFYKNEGNKIISFEDIKWEEEKMSNFTKSDIKNGAVVILRNERRYLKVDNTLLDLCWNGDFMDLDNYSEKLTYRDKSFDIIKVLNPRENNIHKRCCNFALCDLKDINVEWTWERKETKKIKLKDMTEEQYKKWNQEHCHEYNCSKCIFNLVRCMPATKASWVNSKYLYSDKFLNQEIELED